ncbi:hypothetical protein BBJ28_00020364 [Nothophytophthora sp. Chile5]|nr:hypothetical protein BBJ28_00020364 [Nothophytophthora sp. Chile5]
MMMETKGEMEKEQLAVCVRVLALSSIVHGKGDDDGDDDGDDETEVTDLQYMHRYGSPNGWLCVSIHAFSSSHVHACGIRERLYHIIMAELQVRSGSFS